MAFNIKKCKVMHVGRGNPQNLYNMEGHQLEVTEVERNIGVMVTNTLKPSAQCAKAARTAQAVLGQISRAFYYRDHHGFIRLYCQYVRPHLEFSTQAWSPWQEGDKAALEKVQRKAVGMVSGLAAKSYEDRLKELGLQSLEERRHQADMLMVSKILHGTGGLKYETWFEMASDKGRATRASADEFNVKEKHGRLELRESFFGVRVTKLWNAVPADIKKLVPAWRFKKAYRLVREDQVHVA